MIVVRNKPARLKCNDHLFGYCGAGCSVLVSFALTGGVVLLLSVYLPRFIDQ